MLHEIQLSGRTRSSDNDLLYISREEIKSLIYKNLPLQEKEMSIVMHLKANKPEAIKGTIQNVVSQDYDNWHLYIIEDGIATMEHDLLKGYVNDPRITVFRTNKDVGFDAVFNNVIFSYSYSDFFGILFPGQVLDTGALKSIAQKLRAGYQMLQVVQGEASGKSMANPAQCIFFTRGSYCKGLGFNESWGLIKYYLNEFVALAYKSKAKVQTVGMLSKDNILPLHENLIKAAEKAGFRENYIFNRDKLVFVVTAAEELGQEELDRKIANLLDYKFTGYHNYKLVFDAHPLIKDKIPANHKIIKRGNNVTLGDFYDRQADFYGHVNLSQDLEPGWMKRMHLACIATKSGVISDGASKEDRSTFVSHGVEFVREDRFNKNLFLVRKRYVDALDDSSKQMNIFQLASTLAKGKYQICGVESKAETSLSSPVAIMKPLTIRVLAASDGNRYEVWWGDYWFKHGVADGLRALGFNVVFGNAKSDVDIFLHAQGLDRRVNAPTKLAWIITRPKTALGQTGFFKQFDHLFSLSEGAVDAFKARGVDSSFMQCGTARTYCYNPNQPKPYDFCMIGNSGKPRRIALLKRLKQLGYKGIVYGTGWQQFPDLQEYWGGKYWANSDIEGIFNRAKVVIYAHHEEMRKMGLIAQRLLDICAMGFPCLTDQNAALGKYGLNVPVYTSDEDFINKMKFYTRNDANLMKLQKQAIQYSEQARKYDFCKVAEHIAETLKSLKRV